MNIAFCYESVLPARGGCETYITDLARRLLAEGHEVHLYACRWDEQRMPAGVRYHRLEPVRGVRFVKPWLFAAQCQEALAKERHDVTMGFNKTWGQDILYPQGGLHAASADHNLNKYPPGLSRELVRLWKHVDPSHLSFARLERRQYLTRPRPLIVVNSLMVRRHCEQYYGIPAGEVEVLRSAIDPARFAEQDRPRRRHEWRQRHGIAPDETVALFSGINYRLKGLDPLLYAVRVLLQTPEYRAAERKFRLVVTGHSNYRGYERLARRLGIAGYVTFAGLCGEMRDAYFASDFLVHPTFYDPCSLVALEALTCGLPVVTSRYNGASELMRPLQEGYVVDDPHDHARLAWAVAQLLDGERRHACAVAARKTAGTWTFDHHYRALVGLFEKAAAWKRAA